MSNWSSLGGKLLVCLGIGGALLSGAGGGCQETGRGRATGLDRPVGVLVAPPVAASPNPAPLREVAPPPVPASAAVPAPAASPDPAGAELVEAKALKQIPGLYLGRSIELKQAHCYSADANDYRCKVVGAPGLFVFSEAIDPPAARTALEGVCGDVRSARRLPCAWTLRFVLTRFAQDKAYDRLIIYAGPMILVPLAAKSKNIKI